jgi:hypothetical protein
MATDEPDERIAHVRVCGGGRRVTAASTRHLTRAFGAPLYRGFFASVGSDCIVVSVGSLNRRGAADAHRWAAP